MCGGHDTAHKPIAAAFATQGCGDVLGVGNAIAGHAAVTRNEEYIIGTYARRSVSCNHLDGTSSSAVAAHVGRSSNGDIAAPVNHWIGTVEGIAASDAASYGVVVYKVIRKGHAKAATCCAAGSGVADHHNAAAKTTIATKAIGSAVIDGNGAGSADGITYHSGTRCGRKTFRAFIQEGFVYNVLVNTEQGLKLGRFGGLILFLSGFYLIVLLARHRKQADAKSK